MFLFTEICAQQRRKKVGRLSIRKNTHMPHQTQHCIHYSFLYCASRQLFLFFLVEYSFESRFICQDSFGSNRYRVEHKLSGKWGNLSMYAMHSMQGWLPGRVEAGTRKMASPSSVSSLGFHLSPLSSRFPPCSIKTAAELDALQFQVHLDRTRVFSPEVQPQSMFLFSFD